MEDIEKELSRKRGISEKLNIEDNVEELKVEVEDCSFDSNDPSKDVVEDYIYIRKKLRYSVAACEAVLKAALKDMANNPSARVVEGCSAIIKTITECTNQLLSVHEKRKKIFLIKTEEEKPKDDEEDKGIKCRVDEIIASFSKEE